MTVEYPEAGELGPDTAQTPATALRVTIDINGKSQTDYICTHEQAVKVLREIAQSIEVAHCNKDEIEHGS